MPPSWLVTWLVRDIDTSTPAGLSEAFREIARLCLADAKKLDECSRGFNSPSEYILIAHALELGLKPRFA
jgi:hypothetical protein